MYSISPELYREAAQRLCDAIDGGNYFSGTLAFLSGIAECRLTCTVIVYRQSQGLPEGGGAMICDLIPVWWEFHTVVEGEEVINDFSFGDLKQWVVA